MKAVQIVFVVVGLCVVLLASTPAGPALAQSMRALLVEVVNTPTVNMAPGASVQVGNPSSNPAWVRSAEPVERVQPPPAGFTFTGAVSSDSLLFTVPSGKRLVIEYAWAACSLPAGQAMTPIVKIQNVQSGVLTLSPVSPGPGATATSTSQLVRIYADPAQTVEMQIIRADVAGLAVCIGGLHGFLVDLLP